MNGVNLLRLRAYGGLSLSLPRNESPRLTAKIIKKVQRVSGLKLRTKKALERNKKPKNN